MITALDVGLLFRINVCASSTVLDEVEKMRDEETSVARFPPSWPLSLSLSPFTQLSTLK